MKKIGAHVSAAGGIDKAVERAQHIGCNCVQVFSGSPRVWKKPDLSLLPVQKVQDAQAALNVSPLFTHALYLVNLTAEKPELIEKSLLSLKYELEFDAKLGGAGVIVHLGSHLGKGWEAVKEDLVHQLSRLLAMTPNESTFLIENSAGQNGKLCSNLEEIRWLLDQVKNPRLQVCIDTCHLFAAGYSLSTTQPRSSQGSYRGVAAETLTSLDLWSSIRCVHVNDSKGEFGSGLDRHENIGDGQIGSDVLSEFLQLPELANTPFILEVPGIDGEGPDAENVQRLQHLL